jgi:hypothetical protein
VLREEGQPSPATGRGQLPSIARRPAFLEPTQFLCGLPYGLDMQLCGEMVDTLGGRPNWRKGPLGE